MQSLTALNEYLKPLEDYFSQDGVTEITINKPTEIWVEQFGDQKLYQEPNLNFATLRSMASLIAQSTEQAIDEEHPLLGGTLPRRNSIFYS